jgi:hypothetical protein
MDDLPHLRQSYKTFKKTVEEVGGFFRQKEHYSMHEQISFLLAMHKAYMEVDMFFESDEELREGKSVTISAHGDFSKTTLDIKQLNDEFETAISIIYFNLTNEDINNYLDFCKNNSMLKEAMVIKKLFDKFLV